MGSQVLFGCLVKLYQIYGKGMKQWLERTEVCNLVTWPTGLSLVGRPNGANFAPMNPVLLCTYGS